MKVAIVVPVRNGVEMVTSCLEACFAQTRPANEVIVVDNGSDDGTAAAAAAAGARVVVERQIGAAAARNAGWRATDAEIIAFTDVDCLPDPTWLANLLGPFENPDIAGVGGAVIQDERLSRSQQWIVQSNFLNQEANSRHSFLPFFATANVAYRRSVLAVVDGFEASLLTGEDNDIAWKVQTIGQGLLVYREDAVARHRIGTRLGEVTSRVRRYAMGDVILERRWGHWPNYPDRPSLAARTQLVWRLPLRIVRRLTDGRPCSVPLIDAAVVLSWEIGQVAGRVGLYRKTIPKVICPPGQSTPAARIVEPGGSSDRHSAPLGVRALRESGKPDNS